MYLVVALIVLGILVCTGNYSVTNIAIGVAIGVAAYFLAKGVKKIAEIAIVAVIALLLYKIFIG